MKIKVLFLLMVALTGCGGGGSIDESVNSSPPQTIEWRPSSGGSWPVSTPSAEGLDQTKIVAAYNTGASISGLQAMLVTRRGQLVAEAYYGNYSSSQLHQLGYVTTTVMANLIGIAIAQGKINSVNQPITDFLSRDYGALLSNKGSITISHLLTMSSGISWNETASSGYDSFVSAGDPTRYVLQQPMLNSPGSRFNFNSGAMHLLSVILRKATGMSTAQYAQQMLFTPLEINSAQWDVLGDGFHNGATGLAMNARDFAKLATLWQQDGIWQNRRILPAGWQDLAASRSQVRSQNIAGFAIDGYGYGWWLGRSGSSGFAAQLAWGSGGQFALTIPALDFTVITLANPRPNNINSQETAIMNLIYQQILPAIQ